MLDGRIAAAPISLGVCEVPGWGPMPSNVLVIPEKVSPGLTSAGLGTPGFLDENKDAVHEGSSVTFSIDDVALADVVLNLEAARYSGRLALEQNPAIMGQVTAESESPLNNVRTCISYLAREVESKLATTAA